MQEYIQQLAGQPLVLAGLLLIAVLLVYSILKQLFKLALFVGLIGVAVLLWFQFTGRELPDNVDQLAKKVGNATQQVIEGVEKGGELLKKLDQDKE